jgi:hypothetical protein
MREYSTYVLVSDSPPSLVVTTLAKDVLPRWMTLPVIIPANTCYGPYYIQLDVLAGHENSVTGGPYGVVKLRSVNASRAA